MVQDIKTPYDDLTAYDVAPRLKAEARLKQEGYRQAIRDFGDSCLAKLKPGEPIFVLRAQDMVAPEIVRAWAIAANSKGTPLRKTDAAMDLADEMDKWTHTHGSKVPD